MYANVLSIQRKIMVCLTGAGLILALGLTPAFASEYSGSERNLSVGLGTDGVSIQVGYSSQAGSGGGPGAYPAHRANVPHRPAAIGHAHHHGASGHAIRHHATPHMSPRHGVHPGSHPGSHHGKAAGFDKGKPGHQGHQALAVRNGKTGKEPGFTKGGRNGQRYENHSHSGNRTHATPGRGHSPAR